MHMLDNSEKVQPKDKGKFVIELTLMEMLVKNYSSVTIASLQCHPVELF